ncbi:hypothetical protein B4088_6606 [Bacillus cereus]|uniref:Uncharacterized protein n=1 Tax=Bacillus cereus TaxID=1396 RepID=A0A164KDY8_BACCE|nr:hypothetical protein B4088_6606 [Bacillus cereus]
MPLTMTLFGTKAVPFAIESDSTTLFAATFPSFVRAKV